MHEPHRYSKHEDRLIIVPAERGMYKITCEDAGKPPEDLKESLFNTQLDAERAIDLHYLRKEQERANTRTKNNPRKPKHEENCKIHELKRYDARKCTCGAAKKKKAR